MSKLGRNWNRNTTLGGVKWKILKHLKKQTIFLAHFKRINIVLIWTKYETNCQTLSIFAGWFYQCQTTLFRSETLPVRKVAQLKLPVLFHSCTQCSFKIHHLAINIYVLFLVQNLFTVFVHVHELFLLLMCDNPCTVI